MEETYYLYGVIKATENKNFGLSGLSTSGKPDEILVEAHQGLGVVYSIKELNEDGEITASRKNLVNHQKVIELVMAEGETIVPFSFGTLLKTLDEIKDLAARKNDEFNALLQKISGKIELSIKMMWEKMDPVFADIIEENEEIKEKRSFMAANNIQTQNDKIELGQMVEKALLSKKEAYATKILNQLTPVAIEHKILNNITDAMFLNVAFLVNQADEEKFDQAVNKMSEDYSDNILIKYVGPVAPVNFI